MREWRSNKMLKHSAGRSCLVSLSGFSGSKVERHERNQTDKVTRQTGLTPRQLRDANEEDDLVTSMKNEQACR